MNSRHTALALVIAALLAGCGGRDAGAENADGMISSFADTVADEVRKEMAHENFTVGGHGNLPHAELTPEGDLLIDGKKVVLDAGQRALALAYRDRLIDIAEAGARIGLQGADVAKDAAAAAISGVLSGSSEAEVEAKIKASTDRIEADARKLCERLPELMAHEQALAKAVPEFAPYADMTQADIDDCMVDH